MDERLQLLAAYQRREVSMAELCRQFGVSRKTGYKWVARYAVGGPAALVEQSRAPHTHPQAISPAVATQLLELRARHPTWGPRKLVAALADQQPATAWPAASTVGDLLRRQGLSVPRSTRPHVPPRTQPLAHATAANAVWCADFKGDFRTGDGVVCKPLTITDAATRYKPAPRPLRGTCSRCLRRPSANTACRWCCGPTTGRRLPPPGWVG